MSGCAHRKAFGDADGFHDTPAGWHAVRIHRSGIVTLDRGSERRLQRAMALLALRSVGPPRLRRLSIHEASDRDEHVKHARILPQSCSSAECQIHVQRILAGKIQRRVDAKQLQIFRARGTDIGKVGQLLQPLALDLVWMHGASLGHQAAACRSAGHCHGEGPFPLAEIRSQYVKVSGMAHIEAHCLRNSCNGRPVHSQASGPGGHGCIGVAPVALPPGRRSCTNC